jgi:hypothetical protein
MASVNFSEKEYHAVAGAAMTAYQHRDLDDARALNELASKMNKALSIRSVSKLPLYGSAPAANWRAPGPIDKELGIKE